MYAIARVIYGIPLVVNDGEVLPLSEAMEDAVQGDYQGFLSYYSGGAPEQPQAFGVELGKFDEACAFIDAESLPKLSQENITEYYKNLNVYEGAMREELEKYGALSPRVFYLWSTS